MGNVDLKIEKFKDQLGQHGHETTEVYLYVENVMVPSTSCLNSDIFQYRDPFPRGMKIFKQFNFEPYPPCQTSPNIISKS